MKDFSVDDFAAIVGIDWADKKHDICELPAETRDYQWSVISSKPDQLHAWAMALEKRYPGQPIAVACELKKGPLIYALSQYRNLVLFPINPLSLAKYRRAFFLSGAKDDPGDAFLQTEMLEKHMDRLKPIEPESPEVRALAQLLEYRRKLVQDRVDLTNGIGATLKNYYPQVLDWFNEKDTHIFCDFIIKWPSLAQAKRARKKMLIEFFNAHNARYTQVNLRRIDAIKVAVALTDDVAIIAPNLMLIEILMPQLKQLLDGIQRLDDEIKRRYKLLDDRYLFDSLPGAGAQLAPRLLVAFGSNRARYQSASELQKYSGIAPVIETSGQKYWTHWRYSCPTFLRQTFVEWAGLTVRYSFWARAYYQQQEAKGKPHNTIIRSLAFKWIRIIFRCWQDRKPYDESKYLEALRKRGSPLLQFAVKS
jgi:transposase